MQIYFKKERIRPFLRVCHISCLRLFQLSDLSPS